MDARKFIEDNSAMETQAFNFMCEHARKQNANGLYELFYTFSQGHPGRTLNINFTHTDHKAFHDAKTVVMQMAEEGNDKAVKFLLAEPFNAKPSQAVEGYARAGNREKVEEFLLQKNYRNEAARGYAFAGKTDLVNNLIERGIDLRHPAYGYGRAGNLEQLKALHDAHRDNHFVSAFGVEGLAHSNHVECVEAFILHAYGKEPEIKSDAQKFFAKLGKRDSKFAQLCDAAIVGFAANRVFNDVDKFMQLLAVTANDAIRDQYISFVEDNRQMKASTEREFGMSVNDAVLEAARIREVMLKEGLGFADARVFKPAVVEELQNDSPAEGLVEKTEKLEQESEKMKEEAEELAAAEAVKEEAKPKQRRTFRSLFTRKDKREGKKEADIEAAVATEKPDEDKKSESPRPNN